jgi:hypothetical protein
MFKDFLGEAFPIVQKYAPLLATTIVSPGAGAVAMFGLNLLGNAFGLSPDHLDTLDKTISLHPDPGSTLAGIDDRFSSFLQAHPLALRFPKQAEITLKLTWDDT